MYKNLILLMGWMFAVSSAGATTIAISDDTQLVLGSGVDPITGSRKEECIEFLSKDIEYKDGNDADEARSPGRNSELPGVSQVVSSKVITSNSEAYSFMNIEVSAKASYMAYNGSASYSDTEKSYSRSDRMSIALSAVQDYGRYEMTKYRLKPKFQRLADKTDKTEFIKTCGNEFVVGYRLGQGLKVLMTSTNDLNESYSRITASANVSAGSGAFSASASANFEQVAQAMMKFGSLEVTYRGFGTGPIKTASQFLNNEADVRAFSTKVENFTSNLSSATAVKTAYVTRPYEQLFSYDEFTVRVRRQTIANLYATYVSVRDDYNRLLRINETSLPMSLPQLCRQKGQTSCEEYMSLLERQKVALEKAGDTIIEHISKCVKKEDVSECRGMSIPELYPDLRSQILWPKQYRRVLYEAFLRQSLERR